MLCSLILCYSLYDVKSSDVQQPCQSPGAAFGSAADEQLLAWTAGARYLPAGQLACCIDTTKLPFCSYHRFSGFCTVTSSRNACEFSSLQTARPCFVSAAGTEAKGCEAGFRRYVTRMFDMGGCSESVHEMMRECVDVGCRHGVQSPANCLCGAQQCRLHPQGAKLHGLLLDPQGLPFHTALLCRCANQAQAVWQVVDCSCMPASAVAYANRQSAKHMSAASVSSSGAA